MSKSYKLKGDNYIDSSSIVHSRKKLNNLLNNTLKENGIIDYSTNWNNITSVGFYLYNGWAGSDTGSNRPTNDRGMGFFIVMYSPNWLNYQQIYFCSAGIYLRMFADGTWKNWTKIS